MVPHLLRSFSIYQNSEKFEGVIGGYRIKLLWTHSVIGTTNNDITVGVGARPLQSCSDGKWRNHMAISIPDRPSIMREMAHIGTSTFVLLLDVITNKMDFLHSPFFRIIISDLTVDYHINSCHVSAAKLQWHLPNMNVIHWIWLLLQNKKEAYGREIN